MLYPVYLRLSTKSSIPYTASIPDFPGCFTAGYRTNDLPSEMQAAVELWCDGKNIDPPEPSALDELMENSEYHGGVWLLIDIDVSRLNTKVARINITLPSPLLTKIDQHAKANGQTRSGFLALAAQMAMQQ